MSAPNSAGRCRYEDAKVLSTTSSAPTRAGGLGGRLDVDHVQERIGGRLDPHQPRVGVEVRRRDPCCRCRRPDSRTARHAARTPSRTAGRCRRTRRSRPPPRSPGPTRCMDGGRGCHAGCKRDAVGGRLQVCQTLLQRSPGGVGVRREVVAVLELTDGLLDVGGGLIDRHRHRTGGRIRFLAGVDGACLELHAGQSKVHGQAKRACEPVERSLQRLGAAKAALGVVGQQPDAARLAVGFEIGSADDPVTRHRGST